MSWNENTMANDPSGEWGGSWTENKLQAFSKYVKAYLTIMGKNSYWQTIYFDGFAGSGSREKDSNPELIQQLRITEEEEKTYKGAAERVLSLESHRFDYYYFIDKNTDSLTKLQAKLDQHRTTHKLVFREGDANAELSKLAEVLSISKKYAALVLLDPFGMQIDWSSIESLKGTRSDVWILVPTGIIVNRLLDRNGKLKFRKKLESFFGLSEEEIRAQFYAEQSVYNLFGEEETMVQKVTQPIAKIARLYASRMKEIWTHVTEEPLVLKNGSGTPIFHFVFASNNETAKKIAKQIIQTL